ncbi:hypothetical protein DM828_27995 [Pseudomonas umsongensis]|nr:hypothetical protein [Pseudomonas umsongensis]
MGASLLAKAVCQTTLMSTDTASSRAGSLPQLNVILSSRFHTLCCVTSPPTESLPCPPRA